MWWGQLNKMSLMSLFVFSLMIVRIEQLQVASVHGNKAALAEDVTNENRHVTENMRGSGDN